MARTTRERRRRIRETNHGRDAGWYIERNGERIAMLIQPRHMKLYYAGQQQNWTLAGFELNELGAALRRIGQTIPKYRNFSVDATVQSIFAPKIQAMTAAINAKNVGQFNAAYADLTVGCNTCHEGMEHPFLVMKVPDGPNFADQDFRIELRGLGDEVRIVVDDDGPGFAHDDVMERGVSRAGSTGGRCASTPTTGTLAGSKLGIFDSAVSGGMAAEGSIKLNDFRILNSQPKSVDFPFFRSTRLYPEWPMARLNLGYTVLRAPVNGIVSKKAVEPGQIIQPGQSLLAVVPVEGVWAVANFKESQLARIHPGSPAAVKLDSVAGRTFHGHVASVAPATGAQFSVLPPENATGNFTKIVQRVAVRIVLDDDISPAQQLRPGLSVIAKIDTRLHTTSSERAGL